MVVHHIVTGDLAAEVVQKSFASLQDQENRLLVIKDIFNVGPIQKKEGHRFSELRAAFWQEVIDQEKLSNIPDDLERILLVCNELSKFEQHEMWIWMAGLPADICTYFLVLKYAGKYAGKLKTLNINGLPFLDDNNKLFFPKSVAEIPAKEITKALKLVRVLNSGELESDIEDWDKLVAANGGVRILEGAKKLVSKGIDHYDKQLYGLCSNQFQKASKIVTAALSQHNMPVGDVFLGWRLRTMITSGALHVQGDISKTLKDFEVQIPDGTLL